MAKILEDFFTSKFILPEHREGLLELERRINDFAKPVLDEQEIQLVDAVIRGSYLSKHQISLKVYDTNKYRTVTGIAEKVDHQLKQVKILLHDPFSTEQDYEWIPLADIYKATLVEQHEWRQEEKDAWVEAERNDKWDDIGWDNDEYPS